MATATFDLHAHRRGIELLARLGFAAKGAIYFLVGALAVLVATGSSGGATEGSEGVMKKVARGGSSNDALAMIFGGTVGQVLLGALAVGLAGYALWRLFEAAADPEGRTDDDSVPGAVHRIGWAVSGVVHVGLAVLAVQLMLGAGGSSSSEASWAAKVLSWPGGKVLLVAAGVAIFAVGVAQIYEAYTSDFRRELARSEMRARTHQLAVRAGRLGIAARGVVFGIVGSFLVIGGLESQAGEVKGVGAALAFLRQQSYGSVLLAVVAVGLVLYGVFMLLTARYRRIDI